MTHPITLPQLGESVTEAAITAWHVEVGDRVEVGQPLVEVASDKVDTEIPAPVEGSIHARHAEVDETVEVGQVLLEIATSVASASSRLSPMVRRLLRERSLEPSDVAGTGTDGRITPADVEAARPSTETAAKRPGPVTSPLVRSMLRDAGVNVQEVTGTGAGGRVTRDDAAAAVAAKRTATTVPSPTTSTPDVQSASPTEARATAATNGRAKTVPLPRLRQRIADRMHRSLQTTAQLTSVVEVDMTRLMASRAKAKDAVRAREGVSLTPLALTARAVCDVLPRHPVLNAQIDTEAGTATYHHDVNLGIAVDTDAGLIVPTIRGAQDLTVAAIARRIANLAQRSRHGDLAPDDVTGGTFTITNTGSRGVLFDTPILNPPQVAILATPLIEKRPVVVTDAFGLDTLAIRWMSYLCLTYDHRLVDGADAARFLGDLKHTIETRELLPEYAT